MRSTEIPPPALPRCAPAGQVVEVKFPIVGRVWLTTTYETGAAMLKDSATFTQCNENGEVAGLRWRMPKSITAVTNNMLTSDEPDHTRLRGIVDEAFRRRASARSNDCR